MWTSYGVVLRSELQGWIGVNAEGCGKSSALMQGVTKSASFRCRRQGNYDKTTWFMVASEV